MHIVWNRDGDGGRMRLITRSIIIIHEYFTIVATNNIHILVSNPPKLLCNWGIDIGVTLTLTMITLRLKPVFILTTSQP